MRNDHLSGGNRGRGHNCADLTTDQVRKKFAEANPKADKMFERFAATQTRSLDRLAQKLDPVVRG
ncbi:hypothetical protein, partial [Tritonibacter mobilis]|uniref:hypothetical protein n=1 Tax=Tritonibacter mobilis TaxID=379347 RepID=UPI001C0839AF